VNKAIRVPEVRVVNEDGQQLGVMPTDAARDIASRSGLDLVEISPNGQPPVVKIMDYGQFKYELKKKAASAKKTQHQSQVKEVKFRPQISDHDLDFKLRNARKFLFEGDKVKCTVMFRGREIVHTHVGRQLLDRVTELLSEFTSVEQRPQLEARAMSMTFAPNRAVIDKLKAAEAAARAAEEAEEAAEDAAEQAGDAAEQAGDAVEQAGDAAEQAEEKAPEEGQGEALSEEERKSASGAEAASADTAAE
jgi:translation initiation factor IF-3